MTTVLNENTSTTCDNLYYIFFNLVSLVPHLISYITLPSNMQNSVRYTITHDGEETLGFFSNKIPTGIIDDINSYLKDNKFKIRNEVGTSANFYKSTGQDYIVHCEVLEGKAPLIAIDLSIPDKDQAERMSKNWKSKSQDIYSYIIKKLAQ